jgi:hypothetical protein
LVYRSWGLIHIKTMEVMSSLLGVPLVGPHSY